MADSTTANIRDPFTQSWIQALTSAADHPLARTVKPTLDLVDRVSKNLPDVDRHASAKELWDFATKERLTEMLWVLPTLQSSWVFDQDDIFAYTRRTPAPEPNDQQAWFANLGVDPLSVPLSAEVTSGDWAGLVRKEAVRQQKALSLTANQGISTLHLPCDAIWDGKRWQVRFEQADWVVITYEDVPVVGRSSMDALQERVLLMLADADEHIRLKASAGSTHPEPNQPWLGAAANLRELHRAVFRQPGDYSEWLLRTWLCAWPIIYREQNLLQGKADIGHVRQEFKACLTVQPRLTLWMLVFAKLICQTAVGRGIGFAADFRD